MISCAGQWDLEFEFIRDEFGQPGANLLGMDFHALLRQTPTQEQGTCNMAVLLRGLLGRPNGLACANKWYSCSGNASCCVL